MQQQLKIVWNSLNPDFAIKNLFKAKNPPNRYIFPVFLLMGGVAGLSKKNIAGMSVFIALSVLLTTSAAKFGLNKVYPVWPAGSGRGNLPMNYAGCISNFRTSFWLWSVGTPTTAVRPGWCLPCLPDRQAAGKGRSSPASENLKCAHYA
jgi:hypothetical protein